jgi:hypothetical protein
MTLPLELDDVPEPVHDCQEHELERVQHKANSSDWDHPGSMQGYQVYRCRECRDYWGCRYQYDAGTGGDDHWHRFGEDLSQVRRHY